MPHPDIDAGSKRAQTDESLRAERAKTDAELAQRRTKAEGNADEVVRAARERADAALSAARDREDQNAAMALAADVLAGARAREDAAIAQERRHSDDALDEERVERQVALASLLAAERQETDSRLLLERADADALLQRREELLALVSHDLRSLLGAIAINTAMIDRQMQIAPGQVGQYTSSIKLATAQMTRLVSDLLEVTSFDAGKFVIQRARHDVCMLVRRVTETFAATSLKKGLVISARIPDQPLVGSFDPDRIAQVLSNLIGNAIKFTPTGGRITVSADLDGTDLRVAVADSGKGIPPERLGAIFERYSQVERSESGGLGLGLYIARRLVEAHGGRIWGESHQGQGSTFFFSLPT